MPERVAVFVDESGQPSRSGKSSDYFVLGAMMVRETRLSEALGWLELVKGQINRRPEHELHWNRIKRHDQRLIVARALGTQTWGRFTSVLVCKRHLDGTRAMNDDESYLYTLRYLCERLSWFARSHGLIVDLTIAHKIRFKRTKLEDYDRALRALPGCEIDWRYLSLRTAALSQPKRCAPLQIADVFASSLAAGFEADQRGAVHPEYLQAYSARLYRGPQSLKPLTYGVKIHPAAAVNDHPWLRQI